MKKRRSSALPIVILLVASGGGYVAWQHKHGEHLGAGTPLDQSHSKITVLSPTEEPVALPTNTSSTAIIGEPGAAPSATDAPIIMTSSTVILSPTDVPVATNNQQLQHLQLGVLLTLMSQQYANGGSAAFTTLKSAEQLAPADLKPKLAALTDRTPTNGPITPALLLVEAQRLRALGAPEGADDDTSNEPAGWLARLVQVKTVQSQEPVRPWSHAMSAVMLQLAANNPTAAADGLAADPLKTDNRLNDLRTALADYVAQNDALNEVLSTYLTEVPQ